MNRAVASGILCAEDGSVLRAVVVAIGCTGCMSDPPEGIDIVRDIPIAPSDLGGEHFVARVLDGDTVMLDRADDLGITIRMIGINAPEIEHPGEPAECFGPEAAAFTASALLGREVVVTYDGGPEEDIYGRTLAYLWATEDTLEDLADLPGVSDVVELESDLAEDGRALMFNEYLASQGYARVYAADVFGASKYQARLEAAQAAAESAGRGLWGACGTATAGAEGEP